VVAIGPAMASLESFNSLISAGTKGWCPRKDRHPSGIKSSQSSCRTWTGFLLVVAQSMIDSPEGAYQRMNDWQWHLGQLGLPGRRGSPRPRVTPQTITS